MSVNPEETAPYPRHFFQTRHRQRSAYRWILLPLVLVALPTTVRAQFTYTTNNGAITITGYIGTNGMVTIPSSIDGYPVTRIGGSAFQAKTNLSDVTIPSSITNIGSSAFYSCTNLTHVSIGGGVISIGSLAFSRCSALGSIGIPPSVTTVGGGAFGNCANLTSISVDEENLVYSSSNGVLFDKSQTTLIQAPGGITGSYTIPGTVRTVSPGGGFQYCYKLTDVTIPASVTNIAAQAFGACSNLTAINVDISNLVFASINGVLFDRSLTTLVVCPGGIAGTYVIPNSVTNLADYAFYLCRNLTQITIPESVATLGVAAIFGCLQITNITIPSSVSTIKNSAFGSTGLSSITIPDSITDIPDTCFFGCRQLTNITLPDSIRTIGKNAFQGCPLTSIIIPAGVVLIDYNAFFGCVDLGIFFKGNPPATGTPASLGATSATVYYLPVTTGWGTTFGGQPTALWQPQMQTVSTTISGQTNQFGFNIAWARGMVVVVEVCTNLANPFWSPLQTNTLTSDSFYFSDPQWTNYPGRFYRLRSP